MNMNDAKKGLKTRFDFELCNNRHGVVIIILYRWLEGTRDNLVASDRNEKKIIYVSIRYNNNNNNK